MWKLLDIFKRYSKFNVAIKSALILSHWIISVLFYTPVNISQFLSLVYTSISLSAHRYSTVYVLSKGSAGFSVYLDATSRKVSTTDYMRTSG